MLNPRVSSLEASATLKLTALTKKLKSEGKDIVNFAAGEPDFDTPSFIKEEAKRAIDAGFTKYTPSSGVLELREAIAKKLKNENNIPCEADNIIVTTGAKYAIFTAIFTLVNTGDEVAIPAPYWVSYPQIVKLAGATPRIITTYKRNKFKLQAHDLKEALTAKTKLLILNYPSNPTGMTYTKDELAKIYDVVSKKKIFVLSDEIYEKLLFDGLTHTSFASFPGAHKFTVTINGFSKSFSMTGWRVGYLEAEEHLVNEASKMIDHTTSCISSISQKAAIRAFSCGSWQEDIKEEFESRRNILWEGLKGLKNFEPIKPEGTFYMFCDITKTGLSSQVFSSELLAKGSVSVIPADSFGAEGFVRLSFATSHEDITRGIERIRGFLKQLS